MPESALEIALDSAARGNPEFFLELHEFLSGVDPRGRDGIGTLTALVALRRHGEPTGSAFETRLYRVLRRARLPEPVKQYPVFDGLNQPFTFIDFAWPARRIALDADGASYHLARRRARLDALMLEDPTWIATFARLFLERAPTTSGSRSPTRSLPHRTDGHTCSRLQSPPVT